LTTMGSRHVHLSVSIEVTSKRREEKPPLLVKD